MLLSTMRLPPRYLDGPYTTNRSRSSLIMAPRKRQPPGWLEALRPCARLVLSTLLLCTLGGLSVALLAHILSA